MLLVVLLVLAYSAAAAWAYRRGGFRLVWTVCALALATVTLIPLALSAVYPIRLAEAVLYFAALLWPSIVLATGSLQLANRLRWTRPVQLGVGLAASVVGLVSGVVLVVFVLRVW